MQTLSGSAMAPTVDILGFPVLNVDMDEPVAAIAAILEEWTVGAQAIAQRRSARVVTANAEIMYRAHSEEASAKLLRAADMIVPDGIGVVKAAAMLGRPLKARVAGADLMEELAALAEAKGHSIYLLGASKESVEGAAAALRKKHPALRIAGLHDGYFNEEERETILSDIEATQPELLFIAMGFPGEHRFFEEHRSRLPVGVMVGVGGSFDALSGTVKRAPVWVQRAGLEWAYRFAQNPRRLKRFYALPAFVLAVLKQKYRR